MQTALGSDRLAVRTLLTPTDNIATVRWLWALAVLLLCQWTRSCWLGSPASCVGCCNKFVAGRSIRPPENRLSSSTVTLKTSAMSCHRDTQRKNKRDARAERENGVIGATSDELVATGGLCAQVDSKRPKSALERRPVERGNRAAQLTASDLSQHDPRKEAKGSRVKLHASEQRPPGLTTPKNTGSCQQAMQKNNGKSVRPTARKSDSWTHFSTATR